MAKPSPTAKTASSSKSSDSLSGWRKVSLSAVVAVGALLFGGGVFGLLASLRQPPEVREPIEKVFQVEVFRAERTDLQEIVSSFGTARADREVVVTAQVAGEIIEIHPRLKVGQFLRGAEVELSPIGESVRTSGDLIARIDPRSYQERVVQVQNQLDEDEAELKRLEQEIANNARLLKKVREDFEVFQEEHERLVELHKRNAVSTSQLTKSLLELRQYEEAILRYENERDVLPLQVNQIRKRQETRRAELRIARLELERTEVRPPFSGIVGEVQIEQGQYLRVGDPLIRLTDVSRIEIPVPLTLADYAKLEPRLSAGEFPRVQLAENETADARWSGEVVRTAPEADELTRTINVFVQVDNDDQKVPVLPGTFLHARIDGPELKEVIVVPRDALVRGRLFVAMPDGTVEERRVQIGRTLQSLALIESGIESGEEVILTNLDVIHHGARVDVQSHRDLADELKRQRIQAARSLLAERDHNLPKSDPVN